jgi:hypothetical protein
MKKLTYLLILLSLFGAVACQPPSPPPAPPTGFRVQTLGQDFVNNIPTTPPIPTPGIGFSSQFIFNSRPTTGTLRSCAGTTDITSHFPCPDREAPAVWEFKHTSGFCVGAPPVLSDGDVEPGSTVHFICERHFRQFFFAPQGVDVDAPPATIEFTGDGMTSTYGMPEITIVNSETGEVVANVTATAINAEGTWIQAPTPFLGFNYSGQYAAVVYNKLADGTEDPTGGDWFQLYGNDPPPPPSDDPCASPYRDSNMEQMPCEYNTY